MPRACIATITAFFALLLMPLAAESAVYKDAKAPLEVRVNDLFAQLTPDERLTLLEGTHFTTQPIPRLGIPPMVMSDGPLGVRGGDLRNMGPATLFPSGITMASSWDQELMGRIGKAIGEEALNKGIGTQVLLGPAVNIHRTPLGGRNAEYYSEDPYLAARLVVPYIQGMQSTGTEACIKHFACNNQETNRGTIDVHVSERALREIYLPAFEAGVKEGHVDAVMSAYNLINGYHATAYKYLLTDILKKCWGFDGLVISDWGAVHEVGVLNAGNDLEMPGPHDLTLDALHKALKEGKVSQASVDEAVHRVLRAIIRSGLMDGPKIPNPALVNTPEHQKLAYEAAAKGIVLLKNDGAVLPIDPSRIHTIALIGQGSVKPQLSAAGSPAVPPPYFITPLQAITHRADSAINILSVPETGIEVVIPPSVLFKDTHKKDAGLKAEYFNDRNTDGKPFMVRVDPKIDFSAKDKNAPEIQGNENSVPGLSGDVYNVRWTGQIVAPETGAYYFNFTADSGAVYFDGKLMTELWERPQPFSVEMKAGETHALRVDYFHVTNWTEARLSWITPSAHAYTEAVEAAKKADMAVVCVTTMGLEGEGHDRPSMDLPVDQDGLIRAVCAANKNVVVVLNNGTPVSMKSWLPQAPAVIETWFPGMEGSNALAAILFGDVNPSGKLPDTLGVNREDYPDFGNYPGANGVENYAEGIFVGYRHFDKAGINPLFPFGFGLSYTNFAYSNLKLSKTDIAPTDTITVTVDIKNTGARAGEEVAELYIHDPAPKIEKAVRELKGFAKIALEPGETKTVSFELTPRAFAYCDVPGKQWKADAGDYDIEIGASSRDLKQKATVHLAPAYTDPIPFMAAPGESK